MLEVNRFQGNSLSLRGGTVKLTPGSSMPSTLANITAPSGNLDLSDNKLVITNGSIGTWNGSNYTGVLGQIKSGRNAGAWNGAGIITSQSLAVSQTTTLAVAKAADVNKTTFGGISISANDVLVMYTYTGDANLDGKINADDYFAIDSHYNKPSVPSYIAGDFNYDGKINGDDYALIDNAFASQTITYGPSGVTSVPEPSTLAALALTTLALRRRRHSTFVPHLVQNLAPG